MFGHRYFGARYYGPRYYGPSLAGVGQTVIIHGGVSTGTMGTSGVSYIATRLTPSGGGTYLVEYETTVSKDNRDSPNMEDYTIT
jgi:hypothetical protein